MRKETEEQLTGIGSVRDVKEMRVEFDVFKKLSPGQAVLIDKAHHKEDLLKIWKVEGNLKDSDNKKFPKYVEWFLGPLRDKFISWKEAPPRVLGDEFQTVKAIDKGEDEVQSEWKAHLLSLSNLTGKQSEKKEIHS